MKPDSTKKFGHSRLAYRLQDSNPCPKILHNHVNATARPWLSRRNRGAT
jgi:hypothetical protein